MADTDLTVIVKALLESKGFDDLQKRLKEAKTGTTEASAGAKDFSSAIEGLGGRLLAAAGLAFGAAEAISFLKGSFKEFIEASRAVDQMTAANKMLAGATDESTEANKAWIDSMEIASGMQETALIPSYLQLVEVTGNVTKAQELLQIAAGASAAGLGDLGQITQALAKYWQTGEAGSRGFGKAIKALNDEGITGDAVFQKLFERFGKGGADIHNLGMEVDRAKVRWDNTKEAIGSLASTLVSHLAPALQIAATGIGGLISFVNYLLVPIKVLGMSLGQIGAALFHLVTGQFKAAADDMKEMWTKAAKIGSDAVDFNVKVMGKIDAEWNKHADNLKKTSTDLTGSHKKEGDALTELKKKYQELADNAVKWGMEEVQARLAVLRVYQQMANDPAVAKFPDLQAEANKRLVASVNALGQAVAKQAEDEIREHAKLDKAIEKSNQDFLKGETEKIAAYRKARAEELKIAKLHYEALGHLDANARDAYLAILKAETADVRLEEQLRREYAEETAKIKKRLQDAELQGMLATAQAAVGFAQEAFGENKAVMIAQAIISTYAGAARALEDYPAPYSYVVAALTIATGLAQVAKITEAEPGKGFDDPANDFAAVAGGRKWAKDMVGYYSQGASAGFSQALMSRAGGGSSVSNVSNRGGDRHISVTFNGILSADQVSLMKFTKTHLTPVLNRLDQRRNM